ncbi:c-type cytochrome [Methylocystis sp. S23]
MQEIDDHIIARAPSRLLAAGTMAALLAMLLASANARAADVSRGQYLVEAVAACDNCHTPRGGEGYDLSARFSGGSQTFSEKTYKVRGPNISSDREAGTGAWSDDELRAAIVDGVGRDGRRLAPTMPSASYRLLTKADLAAIVAFLRAAPPVSGTARPVQTRVGAPQPLFGAERPLDEADLSDRLKRGLYVASLARCVSCHSGDAEDAPAPTRLGAGGKTFRTPDGVVIASNIAGDREKGVGAWSDDELKRAVTKAVARDGRPLKGPMAHLSKAHFSKMSAEDLDALVAWLRALPPSE